MLFYIWNIITIIQNPSESELTFYLLMSEKGFLCNARRGNQKKRKGSSSIN